MNIESDLAIFDGVVDLGLDRSQYGIDCAVQVTCKKSAAASFSSGINETTLLMNFSSSQFGAYTLTRTTGLWKSRPGTITKRPLRIGNYSGCVKLNSFMYQNGRPTRFGIETGVKHLAHPRFPKSNLILYQ